MDRDRQILRAVKKGKTFREVGAEFGISHQRVGQIVGKLDPEFKRAPKPPPEPKPPRVCQVCGKTMRGKLKYHEACGEAVVLLKRLTDYKGKERLRFARYCLRHPEKVTAAQRRWAMGVLREGKEATGRRFIRRSSATYQRLKKAGLLERLPADIEVID